MLLNVKNINNFGVLLLLLRTQSAEKKTTHFRIKICK